MAHRVKLILGKGRRVITDTLMVVADKVVAWTHVMMGTRRSKGSEALFQELLLEANIRGFFHESWLDGIINAGPRRNLFSAYSCRMPRLVNHVYLTVALCLWHAGRLDDVHMLTLFIYQSTLTWDYWLWFDNFTWLFDFEGRRCRASSENIKGCMTFAQLHIDVIIKRWIKWFTRMMLVLNLFLRLLTISHFICSVVACIVIRF